MNIDYETLIKDSKELAKKIPKEKYDELIHAKMCGSKIPLNKS